MGLLQEFLDACRELAQEIKESQQMALDNVRKAKTEKDNWATLCVAESRLIDAQKELEELATHLYVMTK